MTEFITVAIPKEMIEQIDMIKKSKTVRKRYYFSSRAHFVTTAISQLFERLYQELGEIEDEEKEE